MENQTFINLDAVAISITGMLIVFCGLLFISIFIGILPKFLKLLDRIGVFLKRGDLFVKRRVETPQENSEELDEGVLAAIMVILQLEHDHKKETQLLAAARDLVGLPGKLENVPRRLSA